MKRVLVLGGVSFNTLVFLSDFPSPRSQTIRAKRFHETLGSTGAGKALNLTRLGFDVTLYGQIGEDAFGQRVRARLAKEGIRFIPEIDPMGTKRHVNLMDAEGERISIFVVPGTDEPDVDLILVDELIRQTDVAVLNILNYCRRFIPLLKRHQVPIWCDLHDYDGMDPFHHDFIKAADVLFLSSAKLAEYRFFMERWIKLEKAMVVCTHGKKGATAVTAGGRWVEVPAVDYRLRDSNGAGDSFFSGVMYGVERGYEIGRCLRLGAIAAGLCITSLELAYEGLSERVLEGEYQKWFGE